MQTATTLPTPARPSFNENHEFNNFVRCRTCKSVIGEHIVATANSLNGDGPPIKGRVIKFHKGALFNATSQSLLPALVFGTQMQPTDALNISPLSFQTPCMHPYHCR